MTEQQKLARELGRQRELEERDDAYAKSLIKFEDEDDFSGFSAKDYQEYIKNK